MAARLRAAWRNPGLANASVNKTLDGLSQVLEAAVEYEHLSQPGQGQAAASAQVEADAHMAGPR